MLNTKNQSLVTIACVHINVTTPIPMVMHKGLEPILHLALCTFVVETLSMLKVWFPLAFFDLMIHLMIHFMDELEICGPISIRWCWVQHCSHNNTYHKKCNKCLFKKIFGSKINLLLHMFHFSPHICCKNITITPWKINEMVEGKGSKRIH